VLIFIALVIKFINTHLDYGNSLQVIGPTHSYLGSEDYEGSRILPYLQTNKLAWMLSASWLLTEYMSPEWETNDSISPSIASCTNFTFLSVTLDLWDQQRQCGVAQVDPTHVAEFCLIWETPSLGNPNLLWQNVSKAAGSLLQRVTLSSKSVYCTNVLEKTIQNKRAISISFPRQAKKWETQGELAPKSRAGQLMAPNSYRTKPASSQWHSPLWQPPCSLSLLTT
jgi:hypothetical protein